MAEPYQYRPGTTDDATGILLEQEIGVGLVPPDPENAEWRRYQEWLASGNTPDPAEPSPIRYPGAQQVTTQTRTTDDQLHEVFRFSTEVKHAYRGTFRMTAIDGGSGATKDAEARMLFKRTASALAQVGATVMLWSAQDTAAASWTIQPSVDGTDLVISVKGAAGRTIDWLMVADVGAYAPEGLTVPTGLGA